MYVQCDFRKQPIPWREMGGVTEQAQAQPDKCQIADDIHHGMDGHERVDTHAYCTDSPNQGAHQNISEDSAVM